MCLAGYLKKIGPGIVQRFRGRILNIHPALLRLIKSELPRQAVLMLSMYTEDAYAVRALQLVGAVPAAEVARMDVNPVTGAYSLFLPTAAPRLLTYSNPMVSPLNFTAQAATAGKYKVEASATGYVTQLGNEVTATFGAITPVPNFTLVPIGP